MANKQDDCLCGQCKHWRLKYGQGLKFPRVGICTNKVVRDKLKSRMVNTEPDFGCVDFL